MSESTRKSLADQYAVIIRNSQDIKAASGTYETFRFKRRALFCGAYMDIVEGAGAPDFVMKQVARYWTSAKKNWNGKMRKAPNSKKRLSSLPKNWQRKIWEA
ncbi:hypothetical protein D6817_01975, partial [Candidatus Pacearchaeota archaeon]